MVVCSSEGLMKNEVKQMYTGFSHQYLKIACAVLRLFISFQVQCRCFIFICRAYLSSQSIMSSDLELSSQQCLCLRMSSLTHSGLSHLPMCTSPRQRRSCCWAGWMGLQSLRLFQMSMLWTKLPDYSCVKNGPSYCHALTNFITCKRIVTCMYAIAQPWINFCNQPLITHLYNNTVILKRGEIYPSPASRFIKYRLIYLHFTWLFTWL